RTIQWPLTYIAVSFAWIFFRANSLSDAFYITSHLFNGLNEPLKYLTTIKVHALWDYLGMHTLESTSSVMKLLILTLTLYGLLNFLIAQRASSMLRNTSLFVRWTVY